jgi:hypothetical protein
MLFPNSISFITTEQGQNIITQPDLTNYPAGRPLEIPD